jgi:carboxypeptidase C (cathepsin A)
MSPKYLAGESYGTLRASALAAYLQRRFGVYLSGIVLISSVIDMATIRFTEGNDLPAALYLPTYAAIAHYHGLHGSRPREEVLAEATALAARDYPYGLAQGARLRTEERSNLVRRVARLTGLSETYVDQVNLRIEHKRFFRELLRSRGQVVGRLDARFVGYEAEDGGEHPTFDPSHVAIGGPYGSALNHYLHGELGYHSDLPYEILTDRVQPWSYSEFEGRHVTVTSMLSEAMRHNPHLRVYLACGYYDGATPYFAAEYAFAHLDVPAHQRANVEVHYYDAGHMMYVHEASRLRQSAALAEFVRKGPAAPAPS